jgi:hypothetical protein
LRNEKIAEVNGQSLTVGEFVAALSFVPYDALYKSYKSALDFVFRDMVITREAKSMALDRSEDVRQKTRLYTEYMLQSKIRRALIRNVKVTEEEVRMAYREKEISQFQNIPFDSVKSYLQKELLKEKKRQAVPEFIQEKLSRVILEKYPERIHAFYDSVYRRSD